MFIHVQVPCGSLNGFRLRCDLTLGEFREHLRIWFGTTLIRFGTTVVLLRIFLEETTPETTHISVVLLSHLVNV